MKGLSDYLFRKSAAGPPGIDLENLPGAQQAWDRGMARERRENREFQNKLDRILREPNKRIAAMNRRTRRLNRRTRQLQDQTRNIRYGPADKIVDYMARSPGGSQYKEPPAPARRVRTSSRGLGQYAAMPRGSGGARHVPSRNTRPPATGGAGDIDIQDIIRRIISFFTTAGARSR